MADADSCSIMLWGEMGFRLAKLNLLFTPLRWVTCIIQLHAAVIADDAAVMKTLREGYK